MQIEKPFIKLPLRFDAERLRAEVSQFSPHEWIPHPQGHPGNWALPLVAIDGSLDDDGVAGPMQATPQLARCPYLRQALAVLAVPLGRTRLMKLDARAEATPHVDISYYWQQRVRVHVPIVTFPEVDFLCGASSTHMAAGECWIFDTWQMHNVLNPTPYERIHLVADTVGSEAFWGIVDRPSAARDVPFVPGAVPKLAFESSNFPVVMSPWEIDSLWSGWLADACAGDADPALIDQLNAALQPIFREWRAVWAEFADREAGWDRYRRLIDRLSAAGQPFARRIPLPNGMDLAYLLEKSLINALHTPQIAARGGRTGRIPDLGQTMSPASAPGNPAALPSTAAPVAQKSSPPRAAHPIRFVRPIIIVSTPRAGSTLLFETLAQSPDVHTVGGESHFQFESVEALRPHNRGYDSNRLTAADATPANVAAVREGFAAALRDRNGVPPVDAGTVRLLEKTPKNALRIPFLEALFPDALYVYLYRDPRENVASMIDGWGSGGFATYPELPGWTGRRWSFLLVPGWRELAGKPLAEIACEQWRRAQDVLLGDLASVPGERVLALRYGDFVADAPAHIASICAFAGIGWDRGAVSDLPLARHTLTPPHPDKWRRHEEAMAPYLGALYDCDARAREFVRSHERRLPLAATA
jgi:hypothetical protein